jgi:ERCC4-type nuclease
MLPHTFKNIVIKSETLPIGDIIICDDKEAKLGEPVEKLIVERKSISDLLSSIKDGRYEEQSYRLNGLNHHNHNIVYLVEGDVNKNNYFKSRNDNEKLMAYSAMFSLNYYKGFSVFRSFSLDSSWDGTVNGNDVPAGIYRFKIKYYLKPSFYQFVEGQITLFR